MLGILWKQGRYQGHLEAEKHVLDAQDKLRWLWNSILSGVGHGGWQQAEHKLVLGIDECVSPPPFLIKKQLIIIVYVNVIHVV